MVGPLGRPHTATLIAIAMAVGQMVGMYWKYHHRRARPAQVFPPLMPVILTPAHPSYPSNHSFQAHLIALVLNSVFEGRVAQAMHPQLFAMAARIAKGREIAGVHFPSDTDAGKFLAEEIFPILNKVPSFEKIQKAAKKEWAGMDVGPHPTHVAAG
jgi:acid phosphatase (class A)